MKAIHQQGYGSTDVLSLQDVPRPTLGDEEVLVRVCAASNRPITAFVSQESVDDLVTLSSMIESSKIKPAIHRTYPLAEAPDAVRFVETGGVRGKVVISV